MIMDNAEKIVKLLDHLVHHNEHHAEEIEELVAAAKALGNEEAANRIADGVKLLSESNTKLREALKALEK